MRSIRQRSVRSRGRRSALVATGLFAALALTATACGSSDTNASDKSSSSPTASTSDSGSGDGPQLPGDLADKLKDHGISLDDWKKGGWKNWDKDKWLSSAKDFVNPVIKGLWKPERMKSAKDPNKTVAKDAFSDEGVTDPEPAPVQAQAEKTPYHENAAPVGKVFFDSPQGSMVCSGTVIKDPRHPGKSNLVWTAGHCVHAGAGGGWYRNIAFVPSYNDQGKSLADIKSAPRNEVAPYGQWWATWAATSNQWIQQGGETGANGSPWDYAVLSVKPENGGGKSLEETVGAALDVDFSAPSATSVSSMGAWGYPAAPPYDGQKMFRCIDKPGRLSVDPTKPTMYRIGCTMTGGSSGGGWFRVVNGKTELVSNTSIGPITNGWLAGPQLGTVAKQVFDQMSTQHDG